MLKKIKELIDGGVSANVEHVDDYSFKLFSASLRVHISADHNANQFAYDQNMIFLEHQVKESFSDSMQIIPQFACKLVIEPSGARYSELQGCFAVALRSPPNLISGIKKMISKASSQLPKQGIGIVYVACPPYDASEKETKEFWRQIHKESDSANRINAVVITGVVEEENCFSHISIVKVSEKCNNPLPHDFQVLPLLDRCALKF